MGTQVLDLPDVEIVPQRETGSSLPWQVILYNDEHHTFEEVIHQLQKATGISADAAFEIAMEVHTKGRSICFAGTMQACERVMAILREIALTVAIDRSG